MGSQKGFENQLCCSWEMVPLPVDSESKGQHGVTITQVQSLQLKGTIDLSFATSQPEFLPTQIGKLWKAVSANQEKIAIFGNNVTKFVDFV